MADEFAPRGRYQEEQKEWELINRLAAEVAAQEGEGEEPMNIVVDAVLLTSLERLMHGDTGQLCNTELVEALTFRLNSLEDFAARMQACEPAVALLRDWPTEPN